jgi:chromate transporter
MPESGNTPSSPERSPLAEVASLFLRLGATAFGGPAAHIAMMHDEVVRRHKWLTDEAFLDLVGATNLIPGPNSTEMAIHIGFARAGWLGLLLAGACFILPAMLIVLLLAWLYVEYGSLPQAQGVLYGIKPVMIAVVAQALWTLGRKAVKGWLTAAAGVAAVAGYFLGMNEVALLFGIGLAVMLLANARRIGNGLMAVAAMPLAAVPAGVDVTAPYSLAKLFFVFLKIGSILYGSGYVLLSFLHADFVARLGWLTDQQLIDAVAIGQVTPGPVFTTATFIGYLMGGFPGALAATVAIFLPSFVFVAISNPFIPRMRRSAWFSRLLDGLNVASLGLMAAVMWQLGAASLVDPLTVLLAVSALILLLGFRVNSTWLILAGATVGLLHGLL